MIAEFVVFALICYSVYWHRKYTLPKQGKRLPGPMVLPFIGNALSIGLSFKTRNYEILDDFCDKYGPIVGILGGSQQFVVIRDYKVAKEIMNSDDWAARARGQKFVEERAFSKNLGLIWSHGDNWKEIRSYSIKMMRKFGFGKGETMDVFIEAELKDFLLWLDHEKSSTNDIVDAHQLFNVSALNLTWSLMAGIRFAYQDKKFKQFVYLINKMLKAFRPGVSSLTAFPWLRHIPYATEHTMMMRVHKELQVIFSELISSRRELGTYKEDPQDFIDAFLRDIENQPKEKQDVNNRNNHFTEEQLIMVCVDIFFASADTTSSAIEFSVLYMLLYPHVLEKVRHEIDTVVGINRLPNLSDKEKMPYVQATMQEIFRFASINPLNARSADKDTLLNGYFIPKGTVAGILAHSFHMDKETWGDPEVFRPERFVNENNEFMKSDRVWAFGLGKRSCIGEALARSTFFTFFTALVQRYSIERVPGTPALTPEPKTGITSTPIPFQMIAKSRKLNYKLV